MLVYQRVNIYLKSSTLWLFNIAMENGPFIDDFPIKTFFCKGFSMAMLNNQMVKSVVPIFTATKWDTHREIEKILAPQRNHFRSGAQ